MKLRAAVVGVGYLGQFHAQKIKALPNAELIGVCDQSFEQAQKVSAELSIAAFRSPSDLIGKVDYVHIAASTLAHFELAALFLKNKIPILVEKPIAATIEQAQTLCELSEKHNVLMSVGHIERFNPAYTFLKDKKVQIEYLELHRLAPFRVRGSDVSVLHDLTIHDLDLVHWLTGSEVKEFSARGKKLIKDTYDDVSIQLELKNGARVLIQNSRITPQIDRHYRVITKQEVISMNTATLEGEILFPQSQDPFHRLEKVQLAKQDALALEAQHFCSAVLGEKPPAITAIEATKALVEIEKIVKELDLQGAR